ncbi:Voltage-gated Ion Channel (VIC) Superfamily [Achlya hypogyna]|uniref:BK channel n=1 Tax=Achlya hypogyna TaxID=1202772 RepID=A0A1V9Y9T8_ACHHY|nr:Voltage-gated Ion Channel (VIC) Superfamily [Achlya hypogyna]
MEVPVATSQGLPSLTDRRPSRQVQRSFRSDRQRKPEVSGLSAWLLGNDHWDFFHGIPKGFSLRTRVRIKVENSAVGQAWDLFQTVISLAACGLYVVQSYNPSVQSTPLDMAFVAIFSADYLLRFYCAEDRYVFPFTFNAIIDFMAIIPSVYDFTSRSDHESYAAFVASRPNLTSAQAQALYSAYVSHKQPTFAFFRFVRVLRVMKAIQLSRSSSSHRISAVQRQLAGIGLLVTSILFISACLFQTIENYYRELDEPQLTLGDSFYFILVTISTVGYGDLAPQTTFGKFITCSVIVASLVLVPQEVNKLLALLAMQSPFRTAYLPELNNPHVLILGHTANATVLTEFFTEFYHPDRIVCSLGGRAAVNRIPCVIMAPHEPNEELRALLMHPLFTGKVFYVKGSILNEEDLHRVAVDRAQAAFILTDKNAHDPVSEDANAVLRSLVLENCAPELPTFIQIISPSYADFTTHNDRHHILCIDQHKLSLLAKSCLCPGLSTLVCNLFRSALLPERSSAVEWKREYLLGSSLEIYTTDMPTYLHDLSFTKAADVLYDIFDGEVVLIGVHEDAVAGAFEPETAPYMVASNQPATFLSTIAGLGHELLQEEVLRPRIQPHMTPAPPVNPTHRGTYVNPGASYILRPRQTLYVLCESKNVAELVSHTECYEAWVAKGHSIERSPAMKKQRSPRHRYQPPHDLVQASARLVSTRRSAQRSLEDVRIRSVCSDNPLDDSHQIRNHILVVSDLLQVPIETFIKPLRLAHYTVGSKYYHPIVFMSTSEQGIAEAYRAARHYEGVYLLHAADDSKEAFFEAGITKAKCCVLLAEKTGQRVMDGESLDSRVIFRYLTVQKIMENYGPIMHADFTVLVEMVAASTMKVMDSTLGKRLRAAGAAPRRPSFPIYTAVKGAKRKHGSIIDRCQIAMDTLQEHKKAREERQRNLQSIRSKHTTSVPFGSSHHAILSFYAAGYGVSTDVFDSLLCQSFFTPELIPFTQELLCMEQRTTDGDSGAVVSSSLNQIPLPPAFASKTFGDLFSYLLAYENAVAVGLYRDTDSATSLPYVYTVPKRDVVLRKDDLVFILAQPHTQIALESTSIVGNQAQVESRIAEVQLTKSSISAILNKIKDDKLRKEHGVV